MKRILLIEDDKKIAAALCIRLQSAGYEVVTASDGLKGLAAAAQTRPDLVISDIWLPGAVGFMVAERLKNFGLGGVPVIFITASKKKELWKLAQEVGAAGFFEKPYDPEKLLRAIARCLEQPLSLEAEGATSHHLAAADFTREEKQYL
jgi:DNA-binding response OmpR family regulator